jgi:ribosome-binding factor A
MRKNSIKNTRINTEVQKELSNLISREIKDPRINPMTSVVHAEVSPDLKTAKIYISVLGDEESKKLTLRGLRSAASFMRTQLAKTLNLRNTPELTFVIDNSIEYGVHMSKLIDEVNKDLVREASDSESEDDYEEDEKDRADDEEGREDKDREDTEDGGGSTEEKEE